ncbi:hypothetical protein C8A03DRAFT_10948 [Achaetomium macrosporum]|uniref:Uncharacterized protein n=1 Tax=Achaetomium macrosporum TaxID=79813 RepID=A0AAN7HI44_9PEZI|nr:hypothetical protein C8A03DRAFT_10948 [Achaetomium macrosporum]
MCTYTIHIRICSRCASEDTVLISEQLCIVAKASGIFGSCLEGVLCERDATRYQCWQCKESVRVAVATAAGFGRRRTGRVTHGRRASVGGWR